MSSCRDPGLLATTRRSTSAPARAARGRSGCSATSGRRRESARAGGPWAARRSTTPWRRDVRARSRHTSRAARRRDEIREKARRNNPKEMPGPARAATVSATAATRASAEHRGPEDQPSSSHGTPLPAAGAARRLECPRAIRSCEGRRPAYRGEMDLAAEVASLAEELLRGGPGRPRGDDRPRRRLRARRPQARAADDGRLAGGDGERVQGHDRAGRDEPRRGRDARARHDRALAAAATTCR